MKNNLKYLAYEEELMTIPNMNRRYIPSKYTPPINNPDDSVYCTCGHKMTEHEMFVKSIKGCFECECKQFTRRNSM